MKLEQKQIFETNNESKIGHMRCIFENKKLHGQWIPTSKCNEPNIDLKKIQKSVNKITGQYNSFDTIYEECEKKYGNNIDFSSKGINYPVDLFASEGNFNYWIRLMAQSNDYNIYISVYKNSKGA